MSYEPLHHKYRPKSFAELVGQEAIATTLTNAICAAKIAPAYLFTGPRGTGKTSSARILAKSLNCLKSDKPTPEPCGVCDVCQGIIKGYSLDVIEIDAASNTGVDNIREIIERTQFAPVQSRYKVYVIDECLTGDSLVLTDEGLVRIDTPNIKGKKVLSYNDSTGNWEYKKVVRWLNQGERQTLVIKTTNTKITCTGNHLIKTDRGWIPAKNVKQKMRILSPASVDAVPSFALGQIDTSGDRLPDTTTIVFPQWTTSLEMVESVNYAGVEKVYDIEVQDNHNFVANGLCVHNCHMLSTAAFNALLKTLEEPPKSVVFVLATTDPQRVLPTIISRCQRFDFRRIPLEAMVQHLSNIAAKENINITPEAVTLVAQIAQGGLRDAQSLLDQLSLLSGEVTPDRVWDLVGSVSERDLLTLLSAIASDNPEAVLDCTRKILDRGREPLIILQNLAGFYRDLLIAKTAPSRQDLVACTAQIWKALIDLAQHFNTNTILLGQQHLRTAEVQLKNTTQPRLWLEVTLLGLLPSATHSSQPSTTTRPTPTLSSIPHIPPPPTPSTPSTPPTPSSPLTSPPPPISSTPEEQIPATAEFDLAQIWQQVLANFQPISRRELLRQMCHLIEFDGTMARVAIKQAWYKKVQLEEPKIAAAFQATFQRDIQLNLVLATSSASTPPPQASPVQPQPVFKQQRQVVPASEVAKPVQILNTKTDVVTNATAVKNLPPTQSPQVPTQAPLDDWETDEGAIAAQRLAQFFDGEIIRFKDDTAEIGDSIPTTEWENEAETDED